MKIKGRIKASCAYITRRLPASLPCLDGARCFQTAQVIFHGERESSLKSTNPAVSHKALFGFLSRLKPSSLPEVPAPSGSDYVSNLTCHVPMCIDAGLVTQDLVTDPAVGSFIHTPPSLWMSLTCPPSIPESSKWPSLTLNYLNSRAAIQSK